MILNCFFFSFSFLILIAHVFIDIHPRIPLVNQIYPVLAVYGKPCRQYLLTPSFPKLAECHKQLTFAIKYLNIVACRVNHIYMSLAVQCDALWSGKHAGAVAEPSK